MNLMSEVDKSENKRLKLENDYEKKLCNQKKEDNVQENISEDVSDTREISSRREQKICDRLVDSDTDASAIVESDADKLFTFPPDENISDMLDEVEYSGHFPTVTDRYFTPYYKMNVQSHGDDMCIWIHSNRICMLSLAPSHIILQGNKDIIKVDFKVSDKLDRSLNKVSGKSKHGAQPLQTNSNICTISCSNKETYVIKCCMIGKLVEVNETLSKYPHLLKESPHKGGYLAIILPNIKLLENLKQVLLTHNQYINLLKEQEKL
ncbi:protein Simiate-like isoform X1 [Pogonomyrmex barbatus]|uniref:Protein Abitram n=1 Tax=Pogonomyrmex barbatus TaxID=144034 RepID=A0A6I9X233_9HYME|nr:protein Simiate-like isoform X1 [Pogonomyrmex barbatus]XP_011646654.1 protein Simiate-like isoform X1 [Pogonomyrmex barbatus]XP_011646661.1 protein Simiate-like isoform X1 [Pogonomyrmex barbatus]XP_011646669.1 protein Simiate-like isoform X1 [Pogonomyrmex barbatus]XP_011646677.1 protein Simiate-like isoform X1 [Pogonomyrmex barbatus]